MADRKVALVTGAGGGIGSAISCRLAEEGFAVVVTDLDGDAAESTTARLPEGDHRSLMLDVTQREHWSAAQGFVAETYGRLDALVNNAGITRDAFLTKMTDSEWCEVIDVHLRGAFLGSQAALAMMSEEFGGAIVNISSTGYLGNVGQANYSAAKGGMLSLTRTTALEAARKNVRVNAIAPGAVRTPMLLAVSDDLLERFRQEIPLKRFAEPFEIASVVLFLVSSDSSYITGQVIHVCGGETVG
jgi:3-oxoacyl-[acyl-carrier protein] reductase